MLSRDPAAARLGLAYFVAALSYNLTEHAFRELHPVWIAFLLAITAVPKTYRIAEVATQTAESSHCANLQPATSCVYGESF